MHNGHIAQLDVNINPSCTYDYWSKAQLKQVLHAPKSIAHLFELMGFFSMKMLGHVHAWEPDVMPILTKHRMIEMDYICEQSLARSQQKGRSLKTWRLE